jgi:hypothetical protein
MENLHIEDAPSPSLLIRQASSNAEKEGKECFCSELIMNSPGHLRLKCRCLVHYHCLVSHVHAKLSDRISIAKEGINCPYGITCDKYNVDDSYFITADELETLLSMNEKGSAKCLVKPLTTADIEKLKRFQEENLIQVSDIHLEIPKEDLNREEQLTESYINATTKPCKIW